MVTSVSAVSDDHGGDEMSEGEGETLSVIWEG